MNEPVDSRRRAWSSYWASGALHSCGTDRQRNYSGAVDDFWRYALDGVRSGEHILDVATGNGALPKRLWEMPGRAGLTIDAVDLAELAPAWYRPAQYPGIRFHSGVGMEALPFADGTFDWVLSQYGLEYAQWPLAIQEVLRVLKPDGRIALVLHHSNSLLVRLAAAELVHQHWLMDEHGLVEAALQVVPWLSLARSGANVAEEPGAVAARRSYNEAIAALEVMVAASPVPDLLLQARDFVHKLLHAIGPGNRAQTLEKLHELRRQLADAVLRTRELIDSALEAERMDALVTQLSAARPAARVEISTLVQQEEVLGWGLTLAP